MFALSSSPLRFFRLERVLSNLIYGAVRLYGTDPLPRQPAESQLGEDQR